MSILLCSYFFQQPVRRKGLTGGRTAPSKGHGRSCDRSSAAPPSPSPRSSPSSLAIAANTPLMFALIRGILLAPLGPSPNRTVSSGSNRCTRAGAFKRHRRGPSSSCAPRTRTLAAVAGRSAFHAGHGECRQPRAIQSSSTTMTRDYAAVLGVRPAAGTAFPPRRTSFPGGPAVVFLGTDLLAAAVQP